MRILVVTFFIVIIDQLSKIYVKGISIPFLGIEIQGMPYQSSIIVFGNFFKITFIENPGMAFGLQIGGKLFLSLFTIFATILLIFFLYKNRNEGFLLRLALALILGGAIGNLIDRVFYGKIYGYAPYFYGRVVDFLHFDFPNFSIFGKKIYSWPIFNIADVAVTIGFLLILFGYKKIFKETPVTHGDGDDKLLIQNTELLPNGNNGTFDKLQSDLKSEESFDQLPEKTSSQPDVNDNDLEKKID